MGNSSWDSYGIGGKGAFRSSWATARSPLKTVHWTVFRALRTHLNPFGSLTANIRIIPLFEENRKVWYDAQRWTTEYGKVSKKGMRAVIRGIGFDLCEISRMEKQAENERFLSRFFTEQEAAFILSKGKNKAQTMAGIFAAKEALAKSLGTGIAFELKDVEILHNEAGQPYYVLKGEAGKLAGNDRFLLSISHDGGMAGAVCVREEGSG